MAVLSVRGPAAGGLSSGDFEGAGQLGCGAAAYPDVEDRAVEDSVPLGCAPVASAAGADAELDVLCGVRGQGHAPEAFELANRPGGRAVPLVQVELDDFGGLAAGGVGEVY